MERVLRDGLLGCLVGSEAGASSAVGAERRPSRRASARAGGGSGLGRGSRSKGTSSVAIEPSRSSGAGGGVPSAAATRSRPLIASWWLAAIKPGQPAGSSEPMKSMAQGSESTALGSSVPFQSASARNLERPSRGALAPCEMVSGRNDAWRSRRTTRKPAPLGPHSHLCALPAYQAAPSARRSNGNMPGACAPSTSTSIPRARSSPTSRSMGSTMAVALVTWLSTANRVRGVTRSSTAATISSASRTGKGMCAMTTVAPRRRATKRIALRVALYSWSSVSSSSPGCSVGSIERSTVLTAEVALATKHRSSGAAPMKAARASRARSSSRGRSVARKRTGSRSMRLRQAVCSSSTTRGQAPNEPWFRKVNPGSSSQWRA